MVISVFDRVENIVGKGKFLVQAISPFPTMFSKGFLSRPVKKCHCVGMGYSKTVGRFATQYYHYFVHRSTDTHTDGQTGRLQYTPKNICFVGV